MKEDNALIKNGKWYNYPDTYNTFSFSEDKGEKCFNIIRQYITDNGIKIVNPIDLGTGTGKVYEKLIKHLEYKGKVYLVESNKYMIEYLKRKYKEATIIESEIINFNIQPEKSNFIISSFGFPSNLFDRNQSVKELKNVYENLSEDGILITIGWNEKWDDELSLLWKKYIDEKPKSSIKTIRNCNLTWYKQDIKTYLEFENKEQMLHIMKKLFGKHAEIDYSNSNKLKWDMNMGITINTKKEIENILKRQEIKNERN